MTRRLRTRAFVTAAALAGFVASALAQDEMARDAAPDVPVVAAEPAERTATDASVASLCGGLGRAGAWAGGDASGSDLSSASVAFDADGSVPAGGRLVRLFFLGARTAVRLEAAARPSGDPFLTILDAGGDEVASDDDGGEDLAARVEATLAPGVYCLAARSVDGGSIDVAVRLGRDEHEPLSGGGSGGFACSAADLPAMGDDPLDAAALEEGVRVGATVGRTPAWGFTLAESVPLTITATSVAGDPVIRLRDASGALLAENDDADGTNSRIDLRDAPVAGDYCLEVDDLGGDDNRVDVTLARFDAAAERRRRIADADLAPLPGDEVDVRSLGSVGVSLIADIAVSSEAAWMRFDVPEDGVLAIEAIGQGVDPTIVLFDRVGRRLGENDDGPDGLDSLLVRRVRSGSYQLAVRAAGATSGGHVRVLLERYVPAK